MNASRFIRSFAGLALLGTAAASGQPTRHTEKGDFITIPDRVEVNLKTSRSTLVTREIGPVKPGKAEVPATVPVYEVAADGTRTPGVSLRNQTDRPVGSLGTEQPLRVSIDANGRYRVESWYVSPTIHRAEEDGRGHGYPPGHVERIRRSESIPVVYGPPPTGPNNRASLDLIWQPEVGTYPAGQTQAIGRILARVEQRIEALLVNDFGTVTIGLSFVDLGTSALASTQPVYVSGVTYSYCRDNLRAQALAQNEEASELLVYDSLSNSSSLSVKFTSAAAVAITDVRPCAAIEAKWNPAHPPQDATMELNNNAARPWDYDSIGGVDGDKFDLEYTITHEVLHAIGFGCALEKTPDNFIMLFDLFRLSQASAGSGASVSVFTAGPRMLQPGVEAVAVTKLNNAARVWRMSTGGVGGDGNEAAHWKADELLGQYVGIMEPTAQRGQLAAIPAGYLSTSDIYSIDIMGWNLDPTTVPPAPAPAQLQQPPAGAPRQSMAPNFEWTPGGASLTSNLYVFEGTSPSQSTQVYEAVDLTGDTHQMPWYVLDPETEYTWMVTAVNEMGFAYSETRTFTTDCYANCDHSTTQPVLNVNDFTCFQSAFAAQDPYADCNRDHMWNVNDFTCFQAAFAAGCP